LWINSWVRGDLQSALTHADRLIGLSGQYPDPALILQSHASRGQVLMHMGKLSEAFSHLQKGLLAIDNDPPATP
jgi:hypothetical protein